MKIAVVGAGYVGLAVAWFLTQEKVEVTVFEDGAAASSVSTGLLHPYPGRKGLSLNGHEGMRDSLALLQAVSTERAVFEQNGILKIFENGERKEIPEGITVYSQLYLQALAKSSIVKRQKITHLKELEEFDAIVLATGAQTLAFDECKHLSLTTNIGQSLLCRWREKIPTSLLFPGGHITPTENPDFCQVGSTYEHTPLPDPKKALALLDNAALFYPPAKDFKIEEIRSGTRIAPKIGYQPILEKVSPKAWVLAGFGSRGLLYHAMFAKSLVYNNLLNI